MQCPSTPNRPALNIILAEDDDAKALHRAYEKAKSANTVIRVANGFDILAFLSSKINHVPPPHFLVLNDIRMPHWNGIEPLREVRADPLLHKTLSIVLTTSDDKRDIFEAYTKNVAGYLLKSKAGGMFAGLMATVGNFWRIDVLPEDRTRKVADDSSEYPAH
ncbi:response regulator [Leisingera sp. ANG59]|uniref:response regulator n=1 Tax=Leisingera sp. ANG59 TaxID=2675221 RepID=UPI001572F070|nr:response regulator [Leisingera sp. ANG59]NSY37757.1 response regulator [Leisingera sp. ANG59]